jgi:fibronectin-binding autotransporter adhesin
MPAVSTLIETRQTPIQTGIRQRSLRRHCRLGRATELVFLLATGLTLVIGGQANAQELLWDSNSGPGGLQGGDGNWNLTDNNWQLSTNLGPNVLFTNGSNVNFSAPASGGNATITVNAVNVSPSNLTFTANGYTIAQGGTNVIDVVTTLGLNASVGNAGIINVPMTMSSGETIFVNNIAGLTGTINLGANGDINAAGPAAGTIEISRGTLATDAGTTINAAVNVNGGTMNNVGTIGGTTTVTTGTLNNTGSTTGTTTVAGGTLNINTGSNLSDTAAFTVNGGNVFVNADDTVGNLAGTGGTLNFTAGNGLTFTQTGTTTYAGGITGATSTNDPYFVLNGAGSLTLSGANTTTGGGRMQVLGGGTLVLQGGNAVGNNNVLEITDGTVNVQANETVGGLLGAATGTLQLNGNTVTIAGVTGAGTASTLGTIAGTGGITMNAAGFTQRFDTALTYTGATTVTAGTFQLGASNIIADGSSVVVNGGTLGMQGFNDTVAGVSLQSGSITGTGTLTSTTTFDIQSGTVGAVLGGTVGLNKTTAGNATLTGANTYTGTTAVSAGTLNITGSGSIASTNVSVSNTGTLLVDGGALAAGATVNVSGGALTVNGAESITTLTQSAGTIGGNNTLSVSGGFTQTGGTVASGVTVDVTGTTLLEGGTISGTLTGAGPTTVQTGTTNVTTTGEITGPITVSGAGRLSVNGAADIGGLVTVNGGTVTAATTNTTGLNIATGGAATLSAAAGQTLLVSQFDHGTATTTTIGEAGQTGIVRVVGATTTNAGANVVVSAGTLQIGGADAGTDLLSGISGTVINSGATLDMNGTATTVNALTGSGNVVSNGGTAVLSLQGGTNFAGSIQNGTGTTAVSVVTGNSVTLSGNNTYTGNTTVVAGATLNISGGNAIASGSLVDVDGGRLEVNADEQIGRLTGASALGVVDLNTNDLTLGTAAPPASVTTYAGGVTGAAGSALIKTGTNTQAITGTINTTGAVLVQEGILSLSGTNTIDFTGAGTGITVGGGASLATLSLQSDGAAGGVNGRITTLGSVIDYANGINSATPITIASNTTQLQVLTGAATQSGVISEDQAGRPLEKIGAGTLTLSALNTYTGATDISEGTLVVTSGGALSNTANVNVDSGATLRVDTLQESVGSLTGVSGSSVVLNAGLVIAGSADTTFGGNISGTAPLTVQGGGTLTLTGANALTGIVAIGGAAGSEISLTGTGSIAATTITVLNNGTLTTDGGALVAGAGVLMDAGSTFNVNGSESISTLSGNVQPQQLGTVNINGAGTVLTLNGSTAPSQIGGTVGGTGTLNVAGNTTTVATTGNVTAATSVGAAGTVVNNGQMANVTNGGIVTNNAGATITTLTNNNSASNAGTVTTATNNVGGTLTNTGTVTTLTNAGTATNNNIVGTVTNTGTFTNNLTAGAVTNSGSGVFNNTATGTAASIVSSATTNNAGIVSGTMTVSGGTTTNTGAVNGLTTVSGGTLEQDAGTLAGLAISGAGVVNADGGTVSGTKTLTGGTLNANGATFSGTAIANNGGTVNVLASTTASVNNNAGSLNVNAGATLTGNVVNAATTTIAGTGAVSGNVTNSGTLNLNGGITGAPAAGNLVNSGTVNANGAVAGDVTNQTGGQFTLAAGNVASVGGTLTNNSGATVTIGAGSNLTATVNNQAGGTLATSGTLSGALTNAGTVTATTATFTGPVTNSGTIGATAALNLNSTLNNQAGSVVSAGTLTVTGLATNAGTLTTSGNMNLNGGMAGGGTLNVVGGPGDVGDVITVGGAGITQGATLAFDVDLAAGDADLLVMGGAPISGQLNFALTATGANTGDQPPFILVQDYAPGSSFTIGSVAGLPPAGGRFAYFVRDDAANSDIVMSSILNPGIGAIAGSVTLTQSLIGSVINRPSSPFVTGLAFDDPDPCGPGIWARATGGQADASGTNRSNPGQPDEFRSQTNLSASFAGVQVGGDFACFNGSVRGWDVAAGGIIGLNKGSIDLPVEVPDPTTGVGFITTSQTDAEFDQYYGGIYVTAARGPLAIDLQYRLERTDLTVNNTSVGTFVPLGLTDEEFSSDAQTLSGSVSYAFPIQDTNFVVVPTAGFALTKTSTDVIEFDNGTDTLQLDDFSNNRAFIGATVARTIIGDSDNSFMRQFATATYYADFASDPTSTFTYDQDGDPATNDLATQTVATENLGAYGEVSVGLNYVRIFDDGMAIPARQLDASIRADARFGGQLDSWGVTGQVRLQF